MSNQSFSLLMRHDFVLSSRFLSLSIYIQLIIYFAVVIRALTRFSTSFNFSYYRLLLRVYFAARCQRTCRCVLTLFFLITRNELHRGVFYHIYLYPWSKGYFCKMWHFPRVLTPTCLSVSPLSLSLSSSLSYPRFPLRRMTSSRSRRVRVLLTGCHGNLATGLQWPKVDGLRAGAPEQTEQKSVHARTRSWMCVFVRLFYSLPPAWLLSPPLSVASLFPALERTYTWYLRLISNLSRLPVGTFSTSAADSDTMEWFDRRRSRWARIKKRSWRTRRAASYADELVGIHEGPDECRREVGFFEISRSRSRDFSTTASELRTHDDV